MSYKAEFARLAGLSTLPGLSEGIKDEAYREGMSAGSAAVKAVTLGWAKTPKDGDYAGWLKIVDKYAGDQEHQRDSEWKRGFKAALVGHYGKDVNL
jgi:hypothetical protein